MADGREIAVRAKQSYSRAKHAKVVLNLALGLAHRYEAIEKNPVTGTKRLKRPATQATALPLDQIQAIRTAARQVHALARFRYTTTGAAKHVNTARRRPNRPAAA